MKGLRTCHKCKKRINGRMLYAAGWVWHPRCYPNQAALKRKRRK